MLQSALKPPQRISYLLYMKNQQIEIQQQIKILKMISEILNKMKDVSLNKKLVSQAKKKYNIKCYQVEKMNFKVAYEILNVFSKKIDPKQDFETPIGQDNYIFLEEKWQQRQLRLFIWLLIGYQHLRNRKISEMKQEQFQLFESTFSDKSREFLFYKSRLLLYERKTKWQKLEIELLQKLVRSKNQQQISWNRISLELYFISSKKFIKTAQKCREMWFNHLNPQLNKSVWTFDQDLQLIELALKMGAKWALLSKNFKSKRNEHMIKNRFVYLCKINSVDIRSISNRFVLKELKKKVMKSHSRSIETQKDIIVKKEQVEELQTQCWNESESTQDKNTCYQYICLKVEDQIYDENSQNENYVQNNKIGVQIECSSNMGVEIWQEDISQYLNIY